MLININKISNNIFFIILKSTLYNSEFIHPHAGIQLNNVSKGTLVINNCSSNYHGIYLSDCVNNTISGNTANNNFQSGIYLSSSNNNIVSENTAWIFLEGSDNNTISGNNLSYNNNSGIYLSMSYNNTISGNIMNEGGLVIGGTLKMLASHNIDATNLVNGNPLYYYANKLNLGPNNFTNAGQVILVNCNDSLISNLNISYCSMGILLFYCDNNNITGNTVHNNNYNGISVWSSDNNTISGNVAYNNSVCGIYLVYSDYNNILSNTANNNIYGIFLWESDYNIVSGNTLLGNDECIAEENCHGNKFSDNGDCTYGKRDEKPVIPGYNPFFLLDILPVVVILISKKLKQS